MTFIPVIIYTAENNSNNNNKSKWVKFLGFFSGGMMIITFNHCPIKWFSHLIVGSMNARHAKIACKYPVNLWDLIWTLYTPILWQCIMHICCSCKFDDLVGSAEQVQPFIRSARVVGVSFCVHLIVCFMGHFYRSTLHNHKNNEIK